MVSLIKKKIEKKKKKKVALQCSTAWNINIHKEWLVDQCSENSMRPTSVHKVCKLARVSFSRDHKMEERKTKDSTVMRAGWPDPALATICGHYQLFILPIIRIYGKCNRWENDDSSISQSAFEW